MNLFKKVISIVLGICLLLSMTACGASDNTQTQSTEPSRAPVPEAEQSETAAPEAKKPVLLVVSFGTSYNETRDATIGAVEADLQAAYPEYEVRRAFTSQIIIDILAEREGLKIDNVTEAMERLVADGVRDVVIQPTHVMPGYEYNDIVDEVSGYASKFDSLTISNPLLISDEDYDAVVASLVEETAQYNTEGTAFVFMGHGTEHEA
ncbi:MAG: sirohydrochlorin cobaltochelatase, partial [Candidatus Faecousia sp.]|nr:sirohydrochlorin cobaltochelatase [Candidatus Faecousia sp.]